MWRRARAHDGFRRSIFALWSALLTLLGAAGAKAADAPRPARLSVNIDGGACSIVLVDEVLFLAKIELHNPIVESPLAADCRVTVTCAGTRAAVVARTADGKGRVHETDLSEVSDSLRPRVVALAIAELVHEIEVTQAEPSRDDAARAAAPIEIPRAAPTRGIALAAFAHASNFRLDNKWLFGGGVGASLARGPLVAGIDAAIATRDERFATGNAQVLLTYLAPTVGLRATSGRFGGQLGAGFALGIAHITGEAGDPRASGDTLTEFWGAPFAFGTISYVASDAISIGLRAHAGWVTLPVVGLVWNGPPIDIKGVWSGAQLGVTLAL